MVILICRKSLSRLKRGSSATDEEVNLELDVKCLQLLQAVVYNRFILLDSEEKERDPDKYRKYAH